MRPSDPSGWGGGPGSRWGPPFAPWFGHGLLDGFCNRLCTPISTCFYALCCCWLLQECFGGPSRPPGGPSGPPPPPFGAFGPPSPPRHYHAGPSLPEPNGFGPPSGPLGLPDPYGYGRSGGPPGPPPPY